MMRVWVSIALVAIAATPAAADHHQLPRAIEEAMKSLSLDDAVAIGIQNNLDVQVERHGPLISREELGVAWGEFDPVVNFEGGVDHTERPNASVFEGTPTVNQNIFYDGNASISGLVPWLGGEYSLGYTGSELDTDLTISTLSPEFRSEVRLDLEIPLLKNLLWSQPWTEVRRGRIRVAEDDEAFRTRLMDVVRSIEDSYWNLVATKEALRVAQKSLETAEALKEQTLVQYEVGVVSQVEVTEAEAGVAEREVSLIRAEAQFENAEDELANQILGHRFVPTLELAINATDPPDRIGIRDIDVEEATALAFEQRPELGVLRKAVEREELNLRFARNQRLPELNVQGSFGFQGLSGRENEDRLALPGSPPVGTVPSPRPDFPDSMDDFFKTKGAQQWSVRGVLSIPLGNVSERHSYRRAEFQHDRAEARLRREQQVVIAETRRAVREPKAAIEGIEAAERRRLAAEEQLRAERLRLEYGESTPFDVLQRERDLVSAEEQKIVSQQVYHNSVTGLTRAQGTTLRSRNIAIESVIQ